MRVMNSDNDWALDEMEASAGDLGLWDLSAEVANSVVNEVTKAVALLQGVDPMTASALGGLTGGGAKGLTLGVRQAYMRRIRRADRALQVAEASGGRSRHALLLLALEDDRKLELLIQAVEAAMRETDERRVRFYGRIAADGVLAADNARVDRAARIFETIARLDAADLKVLLHVASPGAARQWVVNLPKEGTRAPSVLRRDLPELEDVLDSILARLEALGIVTMRSEGGLTFGSTYKVTAFARACVQELLEAPLP